jgi:hypothetical protein
MMPGKYTPRDLLECGPVMESIRGEAVYRKLGKS